MMLNHFRPFNSKKNGWVTKNFKLKNRDPVTLLSIESASSEDEDEKDSRESQRNKKVIKLVKIDPNDT